MKPSDICNIFPWNSVFGKCEEETSICCMMQYLSENGNEFKEFTFEEYLVKQPYAFKERFTRLIKYCKSEDTARLVSTCWDLNN